MRDDLYEPTRVFGLPVRRRLVPADEAEESENAVDAVSDHDVPTDDPFEWRLRHALDTCALTPA